MADYTADPAASNVGTVLNVRNGTTAADTVPAGAYVIWQNTGAGAHVVTLGNSFQADGLAVTGRTISLAAGQFKGGRIEARWGDANGRVAVGIDGTASEVKYMIPGNV